MHPTLFDLRDPGTESYLRKFREECHLLSLARHPKVNYTFAKIPKRTDCFLDITEAGYGAAHSSTGPGQPALSQPSTGFAKNTERGLWVQDG